MCLLLAPWRVFSQTLADNTPTLGTIPCHSSNSHHPEIGASRSHNFNVWFKSGLEWAKLGTRTKRESAWKIKRLTCHVYWTLERKPEIEMERHPVEAYISVLFLSFSSVRHPSHRVMQSVIPFWSCGFYYTKQNSPIDYIKSRGLKILQVGSDYLPVAVMLIVHTNHPVLALSEASAISCFIPLSTEKQVSL